MGEIPKDVMKAALACAETVCRNLDYDDVSVEVHAIARVIMAERARSAAVADSHAQVLRGNFDSSSARAVESVAIAIRSPA